MADQPDTVQDDPRLEMADAIIPPKTRKPRKSLKDAPPLQKPKPGSRAPSPEMALRIAEERRKDQRARVLKYTNQTVSYIECHRTECQGPGIWIYGNPAAMPLRPENWEASYKSRDSAWPGTTLPVCQCCKASGISTQLKGAAKFGRLFRMDDGTRQVRTVGFSANPRYIRVLDAEETEAFWKSKE